MDTNQKYFLDLGDIGFPKMKWMSKEGQNKSDMKDCFSWCVHDCTLHIYDKCKKSATITYESKIVLRNMWHKLFKNIKDI